MQEKINKQETLEEVAYNACNKEGLSWENDYAKEKFIEGAKWQQKQDKNKYSEEEVINLLYERECKLNLYNHIFDYQDTKEWFEQFKKK